MNLEPNAGDPAPIPEPGTADTSSTEPWPADPMPGPPPVPVYADPSPQTTPGIPASGWIQPGPATGPSATRAPANPIVMAAVWVIGLAGLAFLALGNARLRGPGQGNSYVYGYALGTLAVGLAIGFGVTWLIDRVRASSGPAKLSRIWAMPIAALVLGSQLAGAAPIAASPRASAPPADSYLRISKPFTLVPTTSDDASMVSSLGTSLGKLGLTDGKVERIVNADRTLAGYLVVVASVDLADGTDAAMAGMLGSLKERSVSPDVTTVDGRTVAVFSVSGVWSATWFEGTYFVEVITSTNASATTLVKAVLDAH